MLEKHLKFTGLYLYSDHYIADSYLIEKRQDPS